MSTFPILVGNLRFLFTVTILVGWLVSSLIVDA